MREVHQARLRARRGPRIGDRLAIAGLPSRCAVDPPLGRLVLIDPAAVDRLIGAIAPRSHGR